MGWLIGAWVLWIAYAGLNVCLPNLMLKLAPPQANASYVAAFHAVTGLCYAANTILGGVLVDHYKTWTSSARRQSLALVLPLPFRLRLDHAEPGGDVAPVGHRAGDRRRRNTNSR